MWSFAEGGAEQTMEMKFRKAGFAGRLLEQNSGLVLRGEEFASAAEPAKSVVMEERRHRRNNTTGKRKILRVKGSTPEGGGKLVSCSIGPSVRG